MLQSKKLNASMIAVVVLSVLLAIALSVGATLAWFASTDGAGANFEMSGAVKLKLTNESKDASDLAFTLTRDLLIPGSWVDTLLQADVEKSTTGALVRAKLDFTFDYTGTDIVDDAVKKLEVENKFKELLKFDAEWSAYDGWFYYTPDISGETDLVTSVDTKSGPAVLNIISNAGSPAGAKQLQVPTEWDNTYAGFTFTVNLVVEAVQDYIPGTDDVYAENGRTQVTNTLKNVAAFMDAVNVSNQVGE